MTIDATRATAESVPIDTTKIAIALDTMLNARNLVECIFMAASSLAKEERQSIETVADIAVDKLKEARDILNECLAPKEGSAS